MTDGVAVEEEKGEIMNLISNFYKHLFTTTAGSHMEELIMHISPKVSSEMNDSLLRPFIAEEVGRA